MSRDVSDDFVRFVQVELGSVWALKAMLALRASPHQDWSVEGLVRELRASPPLIADLLDRFEKSRLVKRRDPDAWRWHPATRELESVADRIAKAYAVRPVSVIQMIAEAPQGNA